MSFVLFRSLFKKRSKMFNNKSYKKTYMPNYLLRISVGLFFTLIPLFTTFAQITQVGAVTNASGANVQTLTVNKPTGAVIGDVLIMTLIKHVTGNTDNSWVNDNAGSSFAYPCLYQLRCHRCL